MSTGRRNEDAWIQTYGGPSALFDVGGRFWPLEPRAEDVNLNAIAHHLALQRRYLGATRRGYSVAQHCVLVSQRVPDKDKLWGLLHDAAEAYLGDWPAPLKRDPVVGPVYLACEARVMEAVCKAFGLGLDMPASVKQADLELLAAEKRALMNREPASWGNLPDAPLILTEADVWDDVRAEAEFLRQYFVAVAAIVTQTV